MSDKYDVIAKVVHGRGISSFAHHGVTIAPNNHGIDVWENENHFVSYFHSTLAAFEVSKVMPDA